MSTETMTNKSDSFVTRISREGNLWRVTIPEANVTATSADPYEAMSVALTRADATGFLRLVPPEATMPTDGQLIEAIERFEADGGAAAQEALSRLLQMAECGSGPLVAYGERTYRVGLCGGVEVLEIRRLKVRGWNQ